MPQTNPLCLSVLKILQQADGALREHDLLKALGDEAFPQDDECDAQLTLFRQHFYLMNALYQLQDKLLNENCYLSISALEIKIQSLDAADSTSLLNNEGEQKLREYYLDWQHYDKTSSADVSELLSGFWQRYRQHQQQLPSLAILGLDEQASWPDIQQSYRRLIKEHHPDKGGDRLRFVEIREAYEVLQSVYDE